MSAWKFEHVDGQTTIWVGVPAEGVMHLSHTVKLAAVDLKLLGVEGAAG